MLSRILDSIPKMAIGLSLLNVLCALCAGDARCQTSVSTAADPKELHGGIEITLQAVRAIVLRVSTDANGENIGIQGSDQIIPSPSLPRDEKLSPEYIRRLAQDVHKLSEWLQRDFGVPSHQIYLLGLSELVGQTRDELSREVRLKTGKEITFLDAKGETELNIAGNIPRRYPFDGKWFENRNISFLLDVGAINVKGGFQKLRLTTRGRAEYDYVTWDIPIKGPLAAEAAQNPDVQWRKKVYLTGNIVWALTTLLYPQEQEAFVSITMQDIQNFYYRAMTDPEALLNPDLSRIRDENLRNEARKGREAIKSIYTPKTLAAGADNLRIAATELKLADKRLFFSRNSNFARLLSFVRLQIG